MRMWKEEWRWRQYGTVDTLKRSQLKARAGRSSLCSDDRLKRVVQASRYLLGHRFSACFALKFAPQRGEGKHREGVQISKQSTQNL